ncbi:hypothetical protein AGMMS50262_07070 [Bacteroidia bacterium]|nr:hypothetical protein AGMMS50262_07070 [Bacteroidia bacterium]
MKKKNFGGIAVLAIAAVAMLNVNFNSQKSELSGISLANVEALASGEEGSGKSCYANVTPASDSDDWAVAVRKCSDCTTYWAASASSTSTCN